MAANPAYIQAFQYLFGKESTNATRSTEKYILSAMLRAVNNVSREVSNVILLGVNEKFMTRESAITKKRRAKKSLSRDFTVSLKVGDAKARPYIKNPSSLDCFGAK